MADDRTGGLGLDDRPPHDRRPRVGGIAVPRLEADVDEHGVERRRVERCGNLVDPPVAWVVDHADALNREFAGTVDADQPQLEIFAVGRNGEGYLVESDRIGVAVGEHRRPGRRIDAVLHAEPYNEPVSFDTDIRLDTGDVEVKGVT